MGIQQLTRIGRSNRLKSHRGVLVELPVISIDRYLLPSGREHLHPINARFSPLSINPTSSTTIKPALLWGFHTYIPTYHKIHLQVHYKIHQILTVRLQLTSLFGSLSQYPTTVPLLTSSRTSVRKRQQRFEGTQRQVLMRMLNPTVAWYLSGYTYRQGSQLHGRKITLLIWPRSMYSHAHNSVRVCEYRTSLESGWITLAGSKISKE